MSLGWGLLCTLSASCLFFSAMTVAVAGLIYKNNKRFDSENELKNKGRVNVGRFSQNGYDKGRCHKASERRRVQNNKAKRNFAGDNFAAGLCML